MAIVQLREGTLPPSKPANLPVICLCHRFRDGVFGVRLGLQREQPYFEFVQNPGDCVALPAGWSFLFINTQVGMQMSFRAFFTRRFDVHALLPHTACSRVHP